MRLVFFGERNKSASNYSRHKQKEFLHHKESPNTPKMGLNNTFFHSTFCRHQHVKNGLRPFGSVEIVSIRVARMGVGSRHAIKFDFCRESKKFCWIHFEECQRTVQNRLRNFGVFQPLIYFFEQIFGNTVPVLQQCWEVAHQ